MGYKIAYDSGMATRTCFEEKRLSFAAMTAAFLLLFGVLTYCFWPAGADKLRKMLIPGDPEVTTKAVSEMVEDLRAGESMDDAVVTFCREIFREAGYSD